MSEFPPYRDPSTDICLGCEKNRSMNYDSGRLLCRRCLHLDYEGKSSAPVRIRLNRIGKDRAKLAKWRASIRSGL